VPVELAGITLAHITHVATSERTRIVRHRVPGAQGDIAQAVGRPSIEVALRGIFYGPDAPAELDKLRAAHTAAAPVNFFVHAADASDKVQTLHFSKVLVTDLRVEQEAGAPSEFGFACNVVEYIEPPKPVAASPLAAADAGLLEDAAAAVDGVQDALAEVAGLTDLLAGATSFANPVEKLDQLVEPFSSAADGAVKALEIFSGGV
jgi:hypothetical protein